MQIVSIAPVVPFDGIPHAGGQYFLRHVRALRALGNEVTVVAPATVENRAAATSMEGEFACVLVDVPEPARGLRRMGAIVERQQQRFFPVRPVGRLRRAFASSAEVHARFFTADVIEFQWTETGWLGRGITTRARRIVFAHDVLLQTAERSVAAGGARWHPRALVARCRLLTVRRDERRVYADADAVLVFSEKDATIVRRASRSARVRVVRPPLADPLATPSPSASASPGGSVLFVGAFDRSVNADAALWIMREIAPRVRRRHPDAVFVFAGAHPTSEMVRESSRRPEALKVTGRVESLEPFYAGAALALVPLRAGAGVKFKTVDAMVRGVPVVSTSIGVEGIVDDSLSVFAVADEADSLADAVCVVLDDPSAARRQAAAVRRVAVEEFSADRFLRTLADIYGPANALVER
ncbi:glycosyltransferase involved in cell wall biosynthesis [Microbacterium sp. SORGH_AS 1204]|uniref:glycosyltransferase n=1 Tax=Microbacterium sp. SORGH_AS_1204 TaxID=3041785 RepID=UPI00278F2906|nr:glycosyltransferase [Microbacterium sp. SORGH_AS_1204]MDQ1138227.1 glycosyltransferase involved in cell wall biosynthesis [Microbacterium sp. SORGH_AS_1204]